jgi:hypothetical protein
MTERLKWAAVVRKTTPVSDELVEALHTQCGAEIMALMAKEDPKKHGDSNSQEYREMKSYVTRRLWAFDFFCSEETGQWTLDAVEDTADDGPDIRVQTPVGDLLKMLAKVVPLKGVRHIRICPVR